MSNDDLLEILKNLDDYNENAINDVKNILTERQINFTVSERKEIPEYKSDFTVTAFFLGLILVSLSFFPIRSTTISSNEAITITIIVNIIMRGIAIWCILKVCERNNKNKTDWPIISLLIGGWSLLLITLYIWIKGNNIKNDA